MRGGVPQIIVMCAFLGQTFAAAQDALPGAAFDEEKKLLGADKAVYLMRQVDLTETQIPQVQGLIGAILPAEEEQPLNLDQVRELWKEIEQAKEAGDKKKTAELTQQLQSIGKDTRDDSEFYENVAKLLSPEQQAKLTEAQDRLLSNPSGAVRPVDLLRLVRTLKPTAEQMAKFLEAQEEMRRMLYPILLPNMQKKSELLNYLHSEFRKTLTEDQRPPYDLAVRRLRPDLIDQGLRVETRKPTPAAPE